MNPSFATSLIRLCRRARPDCIVVGELRDSKASNYLAARNAGCLLRFGVLAAVALAASGCAVFQPREAPSGNSVTDRPAAVSVDGLADWAWNISGDAVVRPLQVFSLSGQTYFQMLPKQRIPAIFVDGQPVPFTISPPYLIVKGVPQRFDLMADGYRALVIHRGPVTMPNVPAVDIPSRVEREDMSGVGNSPQASATTPGTIGHFIAITRGPATHVVPHPVVDVNKALATEAPAEDATRRVWRITPSQKTLSRALAEWSKVAGVKLVWKSDVDLPIERPAEYREPKFFAAMASLLSDANTAGYRFFYSYTDGVITVISVKS